METAIILAAHGSSKNPRINRPMFELAESISIQLADVMVTPAFLDGTPDVRTIIDDVNQVDVLVVPFMASQGYYTDVVFPNVIRHTEKRIRFAEALGAHAELPTLVEQRIHEFHKRAGWHDEYSIVIVGHGTRKNKRSCLTTIDLVHKLRPRFPDKKIDFSFIDQNPDLKHVVANLEQEKVLVIPFLMGLGPHTTHDIPAAFGIPEFANQVFESNFQFPFVQSWEHEKSPMSENLKTVAYDAPIGTYPSIARLCVQLGMQHQLQKTVTEGTA